MGRDIGVASPKLRLYLLYFDGIFIIWTHKKEPLTKFPPDVHPTIKMILYRFMVFMALFWTSVTHQRLLWSLWWITYTGNGTWGVCLCWFYWTSQQLSMPSTMVSFWPVSLGWDVEAMFYSGSGPFWRKELTR